MVSSRRTTYCTPTDRTSSTQTSMMAFLSSAISTRGRPTSTTHTRQIGETTQSSTSKGTSTSRYERWKSIPKGGQHWYRSLTWTLPRWWQRPRLADNCSQPERCGHRFDYARDNPCFNVYTILESQCDDPPPPPVTRHRGSILIIV